MPPFPELTVADFWAIVQATAAFLATCWVWSIARRWF